MSDKPESGVEAVRGVMAALAAAISLLERTPAAKKAAPSDKMFAMMLDDYRKALDTARAALATPAASPATHPDDLAVDRFAAAMKAKLAKKRAEGRGGWEDKEDCSNTFLSKLLREHIDKGDPVDVGNLAMMIHQRGERIC